MFSVKAAALRHLPYFLVVGEPNGLGEGSLQVFFEELAEPALPQYEVHVDAPLASIAAAVAQALTSAVRRG
jgi:hypothetical protein